MANTQYTQNQLSQEQLSTNFKSNSLEISQKLHDFSILIQDKVVIENFNGARTNKELIKLKKSIYEKIDFSSNLLNDTSRDLIELQHYNDLSFLYFWSTLNDIIKLRTKRMGEDWFILKYDEGKGIINEFEAKSTINNYLENDYKKLLNDEKRIFINKHETKLPFSNVEVIPKNWINKLATRLENIFKTLKKLNSKEPEDKKTYINDNDLIIMVLLDEDPRYLWKFDKCKSMRNKLRMIHGNALDSTYVGKDNIDHIGYMRVLIKKLLYLK